MITRRFDTAIDKLLKQFPIVCLLGPRQSGKTTAARGYSKRSKKPVIYLDMESPSDVRKMGDAEFFIEQHANFLVIIDEIQFQPELFPLLRHLVDEDRKAGRFLILGSASPELMRNASESLAGRVYYIDTFPLNLTELSAASAVLKKHWFRGGFPDAWLSRTDALWLNWMDGFARTFIERDLNQMFGVSFSPQLMHKLWRMLAHQQGGLWNAHSFAKGLEVSPTTINRYIDYLEGAFMIRRLLPFHTNTRKRLMKTSKVYFRDSGLLHYLLDIPSGRELLYHPVIGYSWEGYVIEQICQLLHRRIQPYYYRTHDGSEMDLILVKGLKVIACIEIKYTLAPVINRGMKESISDLQSKKNFIIIPADEVPYKLSLGVKVCGLRHFLEKELPALIK